MVNITKKLSLFFAVLIIFLVAGSFTSLLGKLYAGSYIIDGEFDGCQFGKLYPISGGGILECQEYNYFYEFSPEVIANGRQVKTIGSNKVSGYLHNGSVIETSVSDDFEGCDFDKRIEFLNGLIFICQTYSYTYSYMPKVKIFIIENRLPQLCIKGKEYKGKLFKPN